MSNLPAVPVPEEDPLLRSARREAIVSLVLTALALTYTVGYAALFGYGRTAESLRFVMGIPDWVFWGIVVPWLACLATSWWFSFYFVEDDLLEQAEAAPIDGPTSHDSVVAATSVEHSRHDRRDAP
jgi:hypothetical protein